MPLIRYLSLVGVFSLLAACGGGGGGTSNQSGSNSEPNNTAVTKNDSVGAAAISVLMLPQ